MTYLELVNQVLVRLREDELPDNPADPDKFLTDPYFKSIGAHVNDAKDRVEDAWQWSMLRETKTHKLETRVFEIPESKDRHFVLKGIDVYRTDEVNIFPTKFYKMRQIPRELMRERFRDVSAVPPNQPYEWAFTGAITAGDAAIIPNVTVGNIKGGVYPNIDSSNAGDFVLYIDGVWHQEKLKSSNDVLKVPSLPVYSLATALASRERGEVGGTPTSELFAIADRHLSDAIAVDSAMYGEELDWYAGTQMFNTNVRTA